MPQEEQFDDEGIGKQSEGALRTPQEMKGELRAFIEMHELPNRMKTLRRDRLLDMDGNPIPPDKILLHDPFEPVKMRGDTIYARYGADGHYYWVKIGDADYRASRVHGYTKARP